MGSEIIYHRLERKSLELSFCFASTSLGPAWEAQPFFPVTYRRSGTQLVDRLDFLGKKCLSAKCLLGVFQTPIMVPMVSISHGTLCLILMAPSLYLGRPTRPGCVGWDFCRPCSEDATCYRYTQETHILFPLCHLPLTSEKLFYTLNLSFLILKMKAILLPRPSWQEPWEG